MTEIKKQMDDMDWNSVSELLKRAGMSTTAPQICQLAFQGSQACAFAWDQGRLIGTARAISDRVKQAAIYDVAVLPEDQGRGIGRMLLESITEQLPGVSFILYASPGKEGFYEKLGFRKMLTGMALFQDAPVKQAKGFID